MCAWSNRVVVDSSALAVAHLYDASHAAAVASWLTKNVPNKAGRAVDDFVLTLREHQVFAQSQLAASAAAAAAAVADVPTSSSAVPDGAPSTAAVGTTVLAAALAALPAVAASSQTAGTGVRNSVGSSHERGVAHADPVDAALSTVRRYRCVDFP